MKNCDQCGNPFPETNDHRKRFCAKPCSALWHHTHRKRKRKEAKVNAPKVYRNLTAKPLVLHVSACNIPKQQAPFTWLYR